MSVESLSAVGIVTAAALYMLAFLAHAVEWASVRGAERPSHDARLRSETWGRMGLNLTVLGAVCAAIGVVCRGIAARRLPWGNMYEFVTAALFLSLWTNRGPGTTGGRLLGRRGPRRADASARG